MWERLFDGYRSIPIFFGPVLGALWAAIAFMAVAVGVILLAFIDLGLHKVGLEENRSGQALLIPFFIAPALAACGLPWTF